MGRLGSGLLHAPFPRGLVPLHGRLGDADGQNVQHGHHRSPAASARGGSTSHEPVAEYTTGAMTYWNGEKRKALAASGGMAVGGIIPPDSGIAHCTALAARLGFLSLMKTSVNNDVIRAVAVRKIASPATK
jgi:hypothetical protein